MEDNTTPTPARPSIDPMTPRRPVSDFTVANPAQISSPTSSPTESPVAQAPVNPTQIPVNENKAINNGANSTSMQDTAPQSDTPFVAPTPIVENMPVTEPPKNDIIPGLDPSPSEQSMADETSSNGNDQENISPQTVDENTYQATTFTADAAVSTAPSKKPKKKGKGAVILVAVLIALALIGGAVYAYLQNKSSTPAPAPAATTPAVKTGGEPATKDDVLNASNEIDASLKKVNDTTEFQESDLSDTTLGLQ